jgi:hypothetical protein
MPKLIIEGFNIDNVSDRGHVIVEVAKGHAYIL